MNANFIKVNVNEYASKSLIELKSMFVTDLQTLAKNLELKGYSKLSKKDLAQLVYDALSEKRKLLIGINDFTPDDYVTKSKIKGIISLLGNDGYVKSFESYFTKLIDRGELTALSVSKNNMQTVKKALRELVYDGFISDSDYEYISESLNCLGFIKQANKDRYKKEKQDIHSYATQYVKSFDDSLENILHWITLGLESDSHVCQALALALTSGRRMNEIYCTLTSYSLNDNGSIHVKGLSKKNPKYIDECDFIPLIDAELWLKTWQKLDCKKDNREAVNDSNARMVSRNFPQYLKDNGILKFKDCRDFYAGLSLQIFIKLEYLMPELFTQYIMGHGSGESTNYYRKFSVNNIPDNLVQKFKNFELPKKFVGFTLD